MLERGRSRGAGEGDQRFWQALERLSSREEVVRRRAKSLRSDFPDFMVGTAWKDKQFPKCGHLAGSFSISQELAGHANSQTPLRSTESGAGGGPSNLSPPHEV